MDIEHWVKEVSAEEIPEQYQDIAAAIGVEALVRLSFAIGGTTIYIPKPEYFTIKTKERLIIAEHNGSNVNELALKYNLSDAYVRKTINNYLQEKSQLSLFDKASGE